MKTGLLALVLVSLNLSACSASSDLSSEISSNCKDELNSISRSTTKLSDRQRLVVFETVSANCKNYPDVQILHAKHLVYEGKFSEASEFVDRIKGSSSLQEKELLRIKFAIASAQGNVQQGSLLATEIVEKYPYYFFGYAALGRAEVSKRNDKAAIRLLEKAQSLVRPGEEEEAARALAIGSAAYFNEGNSQKAVELFEAAASYDDSFVSNPAFAAVAASSAFELGDVKKATSLLEKCLVLNPAAIDDPQFKSAFDYVHGGK